MKNSFARVARLFASYSTECRKKMSVEYRRYTIPRPNSFVPHISQLATFLAEASRDWSLYHGWIGKGAEGVRLRREDAAASPFGTLTYTYDGAGNIASLKSSNEGGASMSYGYDQLNRLSSVTDPGGVTNYTYDPVGNLAGYSYPNGVSTSYTYDTLNRLTNTSRHVAQALLPVLREPQFPVTPIRWARPGTGCRWPS